MCRIMEDNDFTKDIKKRMVDTRLPRIISQARTDEKMSITKLLSEMDVAVTEGIKTFLSEPDFIL